MIYNKALGVGDKLISIKNFELVLRYTTYDSI